LDVTGGYEDADFAPKEEEGGVESDAAPEIFEIAA